MSLTKLITSISAVLTARRGSLVEVNETYSSCDMLKNQLNCSKEYMIEPVGGINTKVIDFVDMVKAKVIFIKSTVPIFITLTFDPTAPVPPLTTPTVEIYVREFIYLTTEVTAITITNPNAGTPGTDDAMVTVSFVGD